MLYYTSSIALSISGSPGRSAQFSSPCPTQTFFIIPSLFTRKVPGVFDVSECTRIWKATPYIRDTSNPESARTISSLPASFCQAWCVFSHEEQLEQVQHYNPLKHSNYRANCASVHVIQVTRHHIKTQG